ncbi:MAG: hypothetical protein HYZ28_07670 [Myxococcales bacterium]|nr:hypothetical protein [Myxococcales bacterium]
MAEATSSSLGALALAAFFAGASALAQADAGRVVDRAVALVDGRVITLSELEFEARAMLVQAGAVRAAFEELNEETLSGALYVAIGHRLAAAEADKLQAYPLSEAEVEAALQAFRDRFESDREFQSFLDRHDADLQLLATFISRKLRAEKLLDGKLRLKAQVSEVDLRRHYEEHRHELGASSYEELRSALREKLFADRYKRLAAQELERARKAADVRVLAPFARARPEASQ